MFFCSCTVENPWSTTCLVNVTFIYQRKTFRHCHLQTTDLKTKLRSEIVFNCTKLILHKWIKTGRLRCPLFNTLISMINCPDRSSILIKRFGTNGAARGNLNFGENLLRNNSITFKTCHKFKCSEASSFECVTTKFTVKLQPM